VAEKKNCNPKKILLRKRESDYITSFQNERTGACGAKRTLRKGGGIKNQKKKNGISGQQRGRGGVRPGARKKNTPATAK